MIIVSYEHISWVIVHWSLKKNVNAIETHKLGIFEKRSSKTKVLDYLVGNLVSSTSYY